MTGAGPAGPAGAGGLRHRIGWGPGRSVARALGVLGPGALVVAVLALPGCSAPARARAHGPTPATTTSTAPTTTTTTTTIPPVATTVPATTAPRAPVAAVSPVTGLPDIAGSSQVVTVTTAGYGTDVATVTAYQLQGGGWQRAFGPDQGFVGVGGLAPPGQKHEGDGRTPSGTYRFGTFFGIEANPGVRFPWLAVTGTNDVWNDDPSSADYNHWVDTASPGADPGRNPEPMDNAPAYDEGALIDYNTAPVVPGAGSAIFLHVSTGGGTAGCVSVPQGELVAILRWLDPAQAPRIVIGTASSLGMG